MRVLFLGPASSSTIVAHLRDAGDHVIARDDRITAADCDADVLVSFGYRYILEQDILDRFPGRAVNLHLGLLPWNRGTDPYIWTHVDGTPAGVTLHHIDAGIDTGDIIAQREVTFEPGATLRTSHDALMAAMEDLFIAQWPRVRSGSASRHPHTGAGTYHRAADLDRIRPLLVAGWDTPIALLRDRAARIG